MTNSTFFGNSDQALEWIVSSCWPPSQDEDKASLQRFVQSFPDLTFARLGENDLDRFEKDSGVKLAIWLRRWLNTLALIAPENLVWLRFDSFARKPWSLENISNIWFQYGFGLAPSSEYEKVWLDGETMLVIAQNLTSPFSVLAVKASNENDVAFYHFYLEEISGKGEIPQKSSQVVFESLASFIEHIQAIKVQMESGKPKVYSRTEFPHTISGAEK